MRRLHIHLINSPDIAAYGPPANDLRARLAPHARPGELEFLVTENRDPNEITAEMREAEVLVGFHLPRARLRELPRLRWIHMISAGVDHLVPFDWLPDGIAVTNSSGIHANLSGQYALCALLMLNFRIPRHATAQGTGGWDRVYNSSIAGKTVLIVGVGTIGGAAAERAKQVGMRVLGIRRSGEPHPHVDEMYRPEQLRTLLPRADFVLVAAALTPETRQLLGAEELALLPRHAGLINVSRAVIVDYEAMARMLNEGQLGGAVIDVNKPEPLPADSPLRQTKGLLITPHISSDPQGYPQVSADLVAENAGRYVAGQSLLNLVDPRRGY